MAGQSTIICQSFCCNPVALRCNLGWDSGQAFGAASGANTSMAVRDVLRKRNFTMGPGGWGWRLHILLTLVVSHSGFPDLRTAQNFLHRPPQSKRAHERQGTCQPDQFGSVIHGFTSGHHRRSEYFAMRARRAAYVFRACRKQVVVVSAVSAGRAELRKLRKYSGGATPSRLCSR